jgi:hypothetical protein
VFCHADQFGYCSLEINDMMQDAVYTHGIKGVIDKRKGERVRDYSQNAILRNISGDADGRDVEGIHRRESARQHPADLAGATAIIEHSGIPRCREGISPGHSDEPRFHPKVANYRVFILVNSLIMERRLVGGLNAVKGFPGAPGGKESQIRDSRRNRKLQCTPGTRQSAGIFK